MKYPLMYIWRVLYWLIAVFIAVGLFLLMGQGFKIIPDSTILKILSVPVNVAFWVGGTFIVAIIFISLDGFFESKASLEKDVRDIHQVLIIYTTMSLILLIVAVYVFLGW